MFEMKFLQKQSGVGFHACVGLLTAALLSAPSARAQESGIGKPLDPNWWRLSLEEIREGDSIENTVATDTQQPTPQIRLQDLGRTSHGKSSAQDLMLRKDFDLEEFNKSQGVPSTKTRPSPSNAEASSDTTLRDYTTATVNALRTSPAGSTNLFRAMSPLQPIGNMNFGLYNRDPATQEGSDTNAVTAQTYALPGRNSYGVPASPLEVVHASLGGLDFQPVLPSPILDVPSSLEPTRAEQSELKSVTDSLITPVVPDLTATNAILPVAKQDKPLPTTRALQLFQPLGPQPVIQRAGGPNASGFYEPKSISDLQMGR